MTQSTQHPRGRLDWQVGRAHVARAAALMEEALSPSPQRAQVIMDERARELARALQQTAPPHDEPDAVIFLLCGERIGIETLFVREIVRMTNLTRVPRGAEWLLGVSNLRGEIMGVIDIRHVLGLSAAYPAKLPYLIILGEGRSELAIPAEAVEQVKPVRVDRLEAARWTGGPKRPFVRGIGADALVLLEGAALLGDRRLIAGRANAASNPMRQGVIQ